MQNRAFITWGTALNAYDIRVIGAGQNGIIAAAQPVRTPAEPGRALRLLTWCAAVFMPRLLLPR